MGLFRKLFIILILNLTFSNAGIAAAKIPIFVSIVPQKYFVQQIGKDLVDVQVMVEPGESPATYEPKPRQMAAISTTKLYFAIGVPYEKVWLKKIAAANPKMKVIHTDHGIEKIAMATHHHDEEADHLEESHHEAEAHMHQDHNHQHGLLDPHIWLSPALVKTQARSILDALAQIDPTHKSVYEANFQSFVFEIDELDLKLKQTFADQKGFQFIVFHPSWGYFAKAYGLKQIPIEVEGKDPKPAQLKKLIEHAREKEIKVIFVQPQFSTKSARLVANEIRGQVVFADPLAEDWLTNLNQMADKIKAALK